MSTRHCLNAIPMRENDPQPNHSGLFNVCQTCKTIPNEKNYVKNNFVLMNTWMNFFRVCNICRKTFLFLLLVLINFCWFSFAGKRVSFFLLVLINFCWFSFAGRRFYFFLLVLIITWCRSDLLSGKLDHKQLFHLTCFFISLEHFPCVINQRN